MRNSDPIFWPADDVNIQMRQNREKNYTDSINILQTQWYQADLDQRFVLGDQDIWGLIFPGVATYRRKIFNFNLLNSMVQMVSGYQRRNRKSTIVIPIQNQYQRTADQLTKCLYHVHNQSGAYQIYSDAFEQGALTQGIGLISIFKDVSDDPISGDIKLRYVDFKSILIDPYFRRHDLSDCRFIWTRQFFDRQEAANLYPDYHDEIMNLPGGTYRDDKFYYMPEVYQIQFPNLIAFDEYWYLSSREALYLVDTETNECQEWMGDEEQLRDVKRNFRDRIRIIKKQKPTTRRSIILNDKVLIDEPNPYGLDRYPYVPCLGYFTPDTAYYAYKFRGIIRDARDSQYLFNRLKVSSNDILESQQQGIKMKKGALVTPDDALNVGHGRVLVLDDHFQMTDVEQMQIIPPPPTMLQMEEMYRQTMMQIVGANEELMGSAVDDKAGILSMLRQGAGLTTLQRLFDQFDEFQRQCGDIICEMIQKNWTFGKVRQVIGEDPTPEFDSKLFFRYGAKVVPGVLTESQQQLELQQLLYAKELGAPVEWSDIMEKMTLQGKDEFLQKVKQREQAANEQQQKMAELQMQQIQVDNATKLGYAEAEKSLAKEREAKIITDVATAQQKLKQGRAEESRSVLDTLKGIKELQSIDLTQLAQYLDLIDKLKFNEEQEAQKNIPSEVTK